MLTIFRMPEYVSAFFDLAPWVRCMYQEIHDAFILWADAQPRFNNKETLVGGSLYLGDTNFWISLDKSFIRIVLSQDIDLLNTISNKLNDL